ncbi:uncharacterized protein LOC125662372 [Ostrea edulis]|uniref:uncharacterized protein LOC125662372 n=1 Tax=Ostrea edulis TaxID=37623 RepID=UPI0020964505|nr:uncharacterized protein LOC125662372 [Ostrea edulis]XP_056003222.1 uncharacterized protein LOC125662372 [Ostrea edulis]XP_056003223.1 uncharacterized protein LOC125662372 [Ostrea edulis]
MVGRRLLEGKNIAIIALIMLGIYGTHYKYFKSFGSTDQNFEVENTARFVEASLSSMPTCDLPETFFRVVEKITAPTLTQVTPIFPDIRTDKCRDSVKWKPIQPFTPNEVAQYTNCIAKNIDPSKVNVKSMELFNYTVIYSFFNFLKKKTNVAIVEVGGYVGNELNNLLPATGAKHYVVIEPVPSFYRNLSERISTLDVDSDVKAYNFGLGKRYTTLLVNIRGDATTTSKGDLRNKTEVIQIVSVLDFVIQLGIGCRSVDLMTINCEGCEFDVLETLISTNLIENFNYIQFQPHYNAPNLGYFPCRYCRLSQLLARTHVAAYDYPQVWQAWKRKDIE